MLGTQIIFGAGTARKDPVTGDIILSRKPESWDDFFKLMKTIEVPEGFIADRDNELPPDRDLF